MKKFKVSEIRCIHCLELEQDCKCGVVFQGIILKENESGIVKGVEKSEGAKIAEAEMKDASNRLSLGLPSVFEVNVWNTAIEAAASEFEASSIFAIRIRKLKK